jgi:hypothetical protein
MAIDLDAEIEAAENRNGLRSRGVGIAERDHAAAARMRNRMLFVRELVL